MVLLLARLLARKKKHVEVILLADPAELKGDAAVMYGKLPVPATVVRSIEEWKSERVQQVLAGRLVRRMRSWALASSHRSAGSMREAISLLNAARCTGDCGRHPFRRGCGRDGSAAGNHRASECDRDVHRSASGACVQLADDGPTYVAGIGSPREAIVSSLHLNVTHPRDFATTDRARVRPNRTREATGMFWWSAARWARRARRPWLEWRRCVPGRACRRWPRRSPLLPTVAGFYPELMTEPLPETDAGTIATERRGAH